MSTKHALSALFALSLLVPVAPVLAQDGIRARVQNIKTEVKERVEVRKGSSTASTTMRRIEVQQSVVKRIAEHTGKVLAATADRLEKIMNRLESRIAKVKAQGGDTVSSERALAEGKEHIREARAKIAEFASITLTADKMSENIAKLRLLAADAKEHLGQARRALSEAISALKPGRSTNNGKATSTATTTPNN